MSDSYIVDDIVQEVTPDQWPKVADLWRRLDALSTIIPPSTTTNTKDEEIPIESQISTNQDLQWANNKATRKALGSLTRTQLHKALRRNVKHEDPDTLLVRFLRTHSWNIDSAQAALLHSVRWRIEESIFALTEGGDGLLKKQALDESNNSSEERKTAQETLSQFESGESFLHGTDKLGHPVQYLRIRLHDPKRQGEAAFIKASILDTENARMILRPPFTAVSVVFDMNGFSMSNMDMKALKVGTSGLQDHFPEALAQIYVLSAPWIVNGIWSMVKSWLPAAIQSKVHFVKNVKALGEFISLDQVPKAVGGTGDWEFKWIEPTIPSPQDEATVAKKEALFKDRDALLDEYAALTKEWVMKVGSADGAEIMGNRRKLVEKIRENWWLLDPLVRGQVQLDRSGKLGAGGKVNMLA